MAVETKFINVSAVMCTSPEVDSPQSVYMNITNDGLLFNEEHVMFTFYDMDSPPMLASTTPYYTAIMEPTILHLKGVNFAPTGHRLLCKFSDIAILPSGSFEGEEWDDLVGPALWNAVAEGLDVERLGVMGEVTGKTRKSGTRMLRMENVDC